MIGWGQAFERLNRFADDFERIERVYTDDDWYGGPDLATSLRQIADLIATEHNTEE